MAASWLTHLAEPQPLGGAVVLRARLIAPTGSTVTAVRARIGTATATAWDDPDPTLIPVDLALNDDHWLMAAFGLPLSTNLYVSWFAQVDGVWEPSGPVDHPVDLTSGFDFGPVRPQPREWVVGRLQEIVAQNPAPGSRVVTVRTSFPRDTTGWPMLTVTQDTDGQNAGIIRNTESEDRTGRLESPALSLILWCGTPEDRARISPWLKKVMLLLSRIAELGGFTEPSWTADEAEDFETLGTPTFLVTTRLTLIEDLSISVPRRSAVGLVTV